MNKRKSTKIFMAIVALAGAIYIIAMSINETDKPTKYLRKLDYQINIEQNGNVKIVETWNVDMYKTDTLYKEFDTSFGQKVTISDVEVFDIKKNKSLTKMDNEISNLPEGSYYASVNRYHTYEIAWGVVGNDDFKNGKYRVSYTLQNVFKEYKDCQEFYWQLLSKAANKIPIETLTGKINLPKSLSNKEQILVWGQGGLAEKTKIVNAHEISFKNKNIDENLMIGVRFIVDNQIVNVSNSQKLNYNNKNNIIKYENKTKNKEEKTDYSFIGIIFVSIICTGILIYFIINLIRYLQIKKTLIGIEDFPEEENSGKIPQNDVKTPGEVAYLYCCNVGTEERKDAFVSMIVATILNLCVKKKIQLRMENEEKIFIKIIDKDQDLEDDEKVIYNLLYNIQANKEELEFDEIYKDMIKHPIKYLQYKEKFVNTVKRMLQNKGILNQKQEKTHRKFIVLQENFEPIRFLYITGVFLYFIISCIPYIKIKFIQLQGIHILEILGEILLIGLPVVCLGYVLNRLIEKIKDKIVVLTTKGQKEKGQWDAFMIYLINEFLAGKPIKEVPDLSTCEQYIVYTAAFKGTESTIDKIKNIYGSTWSKETWNAQEMEQKYPLIHFIYSPAIFQKIEVRKHDRDD